MTESTISKFAGVDMEEVKRIQKQRRDAAKALTLKRDFLDDAMWLELAKERGLRLPNWLYPPEHKTMRRWLRKLKIKEREYLEIMGMDNLDQFRELNPDWPMRAWVGVLLEYADELDAAKETLRRRPE